jgi:ribosomal protein S18 acetylase RimI-like enzyme
MTHPLDNPIWTALTTRQQALAQGDDLARRFPPEIGPLCAVHDEADEAAYRSLAKLAEPGESLILFQEPPQRLPQGWEIEMRGFLTQMVLEEPMPDVPPAEMDVLSDADVPDMLALTQLTKPGPFRERTHTLGTFYGIRQEGRLVAMAGERTNLPGYTEVSAVCTHPDFQGRGYARVLMAQVMRNILERGDTPYLHAWHDNYGAIRVYEKLGYRQRKLLNLGILRRV